MASLSATEKKKPGNRFRSDSDAVTLPEAVANPLRDYILESARTIHRTELTMAFLRWMLSVVAVFFTLVLVDQWLWPLSTAARYVVWVGFIGGTVIWFTTMVLPLIGRTIHPHYAARQIETTLPEMKEGLITWVQLSGSDTPPPKSVLNAVGRYVAKQLKGQDIASVIDQLNPLKLAAALMGLTLIGAIYLATSPKNVPATIQRLLMPWANIAPATRVQIVSITPGDTSVIQGSNASIAIQVRGWQRQDKATVRYATDDGQTVDQRVAMSSDIEGLSYRIELGKSFGGILQPMHYWVEAGDAIAGPFAIQVQAIPLSTLERVDYVYPAYTRMSPRTIESDGRIEGPEGTRVRVTARGNQPMKSARVEFDSTLAQDGSYQPEWIRDLQVDDRSISGDWILEVNEKRSNPSRYQYRIRSTNMLGESAPEPVVYPMTVVADMAPEVDFAAEIKDIIEVSENSSIDLEMRANDPDFGLVKLVLDGTAIGSKNRGSVLQETLIEDAAGVTGQSVHTLSVAPKQLGLQSGDKINLVLTASDNRHDPQTSKPSPNVVKSRVVTLKVTPPVNNPNPTDDASGGKQKNQSKDASKDPSQSDDPLKSKSSSAPQQPNKITSKEKPAKANEKPSSEQKPNKQDQSKQDQSKQASDQANSSQKNDSQGSKSQEKTPSQSKSTPNQPQDNATDQPQDKDQPPRDQKQQPDKKKPEQQPKDSQSKDQSGKDQSRKDLGSGDDPSGASESSDSSSGQPQGSQKSTGGKSGGKSADSSGDASNDSPNDASGKPSGAQSQGAPGTGKESPSGSQSPGMKSDPSDPSDPQSSGSKADQSETKASDGDASDGQTPTHDGEAFERLQKILNQSKSNDGANGKSIRDQLPSDDKNEQTKDPQGVNSGKPSSDQSKTNKSPEKAPDKSSGPDNVTDLKSGDSSNGQEGNKQQPGDSKEASASNGNKSDPPGSDPPGSDPPGSDPPGSDSKPSSQQNKSDAGKSGTGKSDPAKSNSDDKSKANESSGGDDSKAATDKGNPNQSKTSPNNSPSGQESNPNDSNANESNSKQGRDKSEGGTPNNPKPENSNVKNSQPESNQPKSSESKSSESKSSDPSGSKSTSGQSGEKGASSDSSKQDAANNSSSKSSDGDPAKGNPSKGDSKSNEGESQGASSKGSPSEGNGKAKGSSGESKGSSGSSKSSGASSGGSQGLNSSGESGTAAGSGAGGNESSVSSSEETKEYAKSATDLVLDSLKRQREQPDPELLKRMGWSKEQMQAFVDRWQTARDQAMIDPSKKKDYEDMLQSLGLVPQTGSTRAVLGRSDSLTGIREEGSRVRPPESLRERFEAFRKASQNAGAK